jgi:hypothetical protein
MGVVGRSYVPGFVGRRIMDDDGIFQRVFKLLLVFLIIPITVFPKKTRLEVVFEGKGYLPVMK